MAHTDAYHSFIASMRITLNDWREGVGYDLKALARVSPAERDELTGILGEQLANHPDWREAEALGVIGTPAAREALRRAAPQVGREARLWIEKELAELGEPSDLEGAIVDALQNTTLIDGLSGALDLAEQYPSPRIAEAVVDLALNGADGEQRINCAGLALFLGGKTEETFDWDYRPLFLRFGETDRRIRLEAYRELCGLLGIEPRT